MPTPEILLGKLPPFRDEWKLIKENQKVADIMQQILRAHKNNASFYDKIALYFDANTVQGICDNLYSFLKTYIKYHEEPETMQTTAVPSGILTRLQGDCKHYASFCGGVLDAISRLTGKKIDWCYRFVSYNLLQRSPGHVFVVVFDRGHEIWIDPVPGADKVTPVWQIDKKINVKAMPLYDNIGGVGYIAPDQTDNILTRDDYYYTPYTEPQTAMPAANVPIELQPDDYFQEVQPDLDDTEIPSDVFNAIQALLKYGVVNDAGEVDQSKLLHVYGILPSEQALELSSAMDFLNSQSVGGFLSDVWRGVKKVTGAAPRGAFLSAVALNVFGMASKLKQATSTQDGVNKVRNKWYSLGGDWAKLRQAIDNGAKRARIGAAPAVPVWVATAAAVIAAIMPLVNAILKQQQQQGINMTDLQNQFGSDLYNTPYSGGIMDWMQRNPLIVAAGGVLLLNYVILPKEKRIF